jgi:hypothetical protein
LGIESEVRRVTRDVGHLLNQSQYMAETPIRIHERGVDSGHGLGGPPFHPGFLSWLRDGGSCVCEPHPDTGSLTHQWSCDRNPGTPRFKTSTRRAHPRRLKRALRQLRSICKAEFDIVWLILGRSHSYEQAQGVINDDRQRKGLDPYTEEEFAVLTISGLDKINAAY